MGAREDQKYQMAATELYRLNVERLKIIQVTQADYGKWLMATLSLVHTGALYTIATEHLGKGVADAYLPPLVGLLLTLISALLIWTNFTLAISLMEKWTDPAMLSDDAHWPKSERPYKFWIPATMALAVVTGIASGGCIVWTAIKLAH